jgi:acetyl-CoA hydrolase
MTGWGQTGPMSKLAGHDNNYIGVSGALWYSGHLGSPPVATPTLIGDLGGGALYLAVGVLAAVFRARESGIGDTIDAAIVDGSAHLMNLLLSMVANGQVAIERGQSLLDGPHWYATYACSDGGYLTVGALENKFYSELGERLNMNPEEWLRVQHDRLAWPAMTARLAGIFRTRTREAWCEYFAGSDCCVAPVLNPVEAARHPQLATRQTYLNVGGILQAAPAPRFERSRVDMLRPVPTRGGHAKEILGELGYSDADLAALRKAEII